ncbi:hypothetical protein JW960_13430 [candidate division KSB1 bacterium]|nr:hypothetical protein [candidate division KSB1 bacterium]
MIVGMYRAEKDGNFTENEFSRLKAGGKQYDGDVVTSFEHPRLGLAFRNDGLTVRNNKDAIYVSDDKQLVVACEGNIFNENELRDSIEKSLLGNRRDNAALIAACYRSLGKECFVKLNGNFVIVIWDQKTDELYVVRDHVGVDPLFYAWDGETLVFGTSLQGLIQTKLVEPKLNMKALYTYFLFNYIPGFEALVDKVKKVRPGHFLYTSNGSLANKRYWYLSFARDETLESKDETSYAREMFELLKDTVAIRIASNESSHGAFLSGGMDSSSVVGLMSDIGASPIHTFSFRCKGKTFDESKYAKIMSDNYGTQHYLVEYPASTISAIEDMVRFMDEPFCDIGIEVASYILGREAKGKTNYVLTGDGGDELFAGHPVYLADDMAHKFDRVPRPVRQPLTKLLQFLPDTDKKKSLAVKAKRFSYSYQFPVDLYSNRWRIYYTPQEMAALMTGTMHDELQSLNPLSDIAHLYDEADGQDFLSKTLYGDYMTVVGFYFIRMKLLRAFGLEGRFPMFDHRLVEFAAKMPSSLKIRGTEVKYILHKAMAGFLPDEIVFRKDKLGHSVPMKNWMRDEPVVKEFIADHLSDASLQKKGYFNTKFVQRMIKQHLSKSHNHSHRLWALVVLKLWLDAHHVS